MDILVLGCGTTGSAIIRLLLKEKFIDEIYCISENEKIARNFLLKDFKNIEFRKANALNFKSVKGFMKKCDFVINALPSYVETHGEDILVNQKILEFCLKVGVNYLDLACYGDYKKKIAEQLLLKEQFEKEKLFGLINAGVSPGLTNLIVKESSEEFDYIETIKIRTLEEQQGLEFVLPWSREGLFDIASDVLVYRNYKFSIKEPFTDREMYEYPSGKMPCYLLAHDETLTIPHFIKVRNLDVKGGGGDVEVLMALYKLGIFEKERISVGKFRISPRRFAYSIIRGTPTTKEFVKILDKGILEDATFGVFVDCKGSLGKSKLLVKTYTTFSQKTINKKLHGANYISYPTAISSTIFLKSVQRGKKLYGILPTESLPKAMRKRILNELERKEIILNVEYKKL
jgi:saccharopine dehydrogenase-like NADP-dependent oxidoreductase